jgi:hypothetical protein
MVDFALPPPCSHCYTSFRDTTLTLALRYTLTWRCVKAWCTVATFPFVELRGSQDRRTFDILHHFLYDKFMTFVRELIFKIRYYMGTRNLLTNSVIRLLSEAGLLLKSFVLTAGRSTQFGHC